MVITFLHKICLLQNYFTTEKVTMDFLLVQFDFTMSQINFYRSQCKEILKILISDLKNNIVKEKEYYQQYFHMDEK